MKLPNEKKVVIATPDRPLYVRQIQLRKGTVYATSLSVTRDPTVAAVFCDRNVDDVVDAAGLLFGADRVSVKACRPPRNYRGTFYPEAFK